MKLFVHGLFGCFPAERFAGALVEQPRNVVELGLAGFAEICTFGQELAQQAIGVLVAAALPRRVRIGEPDIESQAPSQFGMTGHFAAPVVGHALAQDGGQITHLPGEALQGGFSGRCVHFAEHHEARLALDNGAHRRAVVRALDKVAFPVARHQALFDLFGSVADAQRFGNHGAARRRCSPLAALALGSAQSIDHRLAQRPFRVGIDGRVNGLVADVLVGIIGVHGLKSAGDLLRRPSPVDQPIAHPGMKPCAGHQFLAPPAAPAPRPVCLRGVRRAIRACGWRVPAPQFTTHSRWAATNPMSRLSNAHAPLVFTEDHGALFTAEVSVSGIHRNSLPPKGAGVALEG